MLPAEESGWNVLRISYLAIIPTLLLYLVYRWALPKPIPGIPYDEGAARSLLGSLPDMIAYVRKNRRIRPWITEHPIRHNSAVTQFWPRPFKKPAIIISDFQESHDILLRRTKEFDRSPATAAIFQGTVGNHHIAMETHDPRFKGNKELVKDLMSPSFLNNVSAREIYTKATHLVDLWTLKATLADGRPFNANLDIFDVAIDIINAAAFGIDDDLSTVKHQLDSLIKTTPDDILLNADGSVAFSRPPSVPEIAAIEFLCEHLGEQFKSRSPLLNHRWQLLTNPALPKAIAVKDKFIYDEIEKAVVRLQNGNSSTRSAMDHILQREINAAEKADRQPIFHSSRLHDELFGYVVAGHDTSCSALRWMIKMLAEDQRAQGRLRAALRSAHAAAHDEKRQPSVTEITKTTVPYLEAFMEENLRFNPPLAGTSRRTTVDTVVLGHRVPKDTDVIFVMNGPDYKRPSIPVPDHLRSETSREKHRRGTWNPEDIHLFKPERWLTTDEHGREVYDPQSGPMISFSYGPRGCFGKRLAYLELRIVMTLLVWNFEFHQLSGDLASHDAVDHITTCPVNCFVALTKIS